MIWGLGMRVARKHVEVFAIAGTQSSHDDSNFFGGRSFSTSLLVRAESPSWTLWTRPLRSSPMVTVSLLENTVCTHLERDGQFQSTASRSCSGLDAGLLSPPLSLSPVLLDISCAGLSSLLALVLSTKRKPRSSNCINIVLH